MKFRTVFNFLPAFIFYPKTIFIKFDGITLGPFIFIKEKHKQNIEMLEHELIHVKQFYRTFGLFCILYLISKKRRLVYEVEAYKRSIEIKCKDDASKRTYYARQYAKILADKYQVGLDKDLIFGMLIGKMWVQL